MLKSQKSLSKENNAKVCPHNQDSDKIKIPEDHAEVEGQSIDQCPFMK